MVVGRRSSVVGGRGTRGPRPDARRLLVLPLLLLLTSCGFFSRAKSTFYSLETIPGTVSNVTGAPIAIEGIELPPGLDRREIVVRSADHRLEVRERQQWSGPLEDMVIHTLAFDLAKRLPEGMVVLPGQAKPAAMRPLYIVFEDLAAGADRIFVLDARWNGGHERITVPMGSMNSTDDVAAMNQALAMLTDRITGGQNVGRR